MKTRTISKSGTELLIEYEPRGVLDTDVQWFATTLEGMMNRGSKFKAGQTFAMGWSVLVFIDGGKGTLAFEELDGSGVANKFSRGVTRSLAALRLHKSVAESFGLESQLDFATVRQTAIACTKLDTDKPIVLSRADPEEEDSGWFFGCTSKTHDHEEAENLELDNLYTLACKFPRILPFLALPSGVMILVDDGKIKAEDGEGQKLTIKPGSFLDRT